MPKNIWEIRDFSGGLNAYADARDIEDTQFSQNWNIAVDRTGVLRVIGCAINNIDASDIPNGNFQKGYGLFQFSSDYSFSFSLEYGFDQGIHRGTVSAVTVGSTTTSFTLDTTAGSYNDTNDYYKDMTIFFYSATNNAGKSRNIVSVNTSGVVVVAPALGVITTADKYVIVRWNSNNCGSADGTAQSSQDWITDGVTTGHFTSALSPHSLDATDESPFNNYFAVNKMTAEDDQVNDFDGYIEYAGPSSKNLSLKAGKEYPLSFYCAFGKSWQNFVADGNATGISDTGINAAEAESLSTSSVTLTVSGTAAGANILNKLVYKSDGSFFGRCTAVNSETEIVFGNGLYTAIADTNDLYVAGEGEKVPWVELYSTTVTDGTNTGLYLQSNGSWLIGTSQSNYLKLNDVNFLPSNSWLAINPTTLQPIYSSSYQYGLHGTTLKLSGSESDNNYIYQNLTLQTNTKYRLNFVYRGVNGVKVGIFIGGTPIVPMTQLVGTDNDSYGDQNEGTWKYAYNGNGFEFTINGGASMTETVTIRLRDPDGDWPSWIDGMTITKAHNDLITMKEDFNGSPLGTTTANGGLGGHDVGWSHVTQDYPPGNPNQGQLSVFHRYSTVFTIPEQYNDVDDWVLRLHSGRWGYQNGATNHCDDGGSTNTQEVYFDGIQITGEQDDSNDKETFTLLQSNVESSSGALKSTNIAINTSSTLETIGTGWLTNYINFTGSAIPIFNYNKGVLRICDSNFANNNDNKLFYYDNYADIPKWKVRADGFLQTPPTLLATSTSNTVVDTSGNYDAIPHINELCAELTYAAPVDTDAVAVDGGVETNWRYDQFGPSSEVQFGIITRHFVDYNHSCQDHFVRTDSHDSYLESYDTKNSNTNQKAHATSCGFVGVTDLETGQTFDIGDEWTYYGDEVVTFGGGHVNDWYSQALTPFMIPIRLSNDTMTNTVKGYLDSINRDNTHIQEIKINVTFEIRTCGQANIVMQTSSNNLSALAINDRVVPTFEIWVVIPSGEYSLMTTELAAELINKAERGEYSGDDVVFPMTDDGTANPKVFGHDSVTANKTIQNVLDGDDNYDGITIDSDTGYLGEAGGRYCNLRFNIDETIVLERIDEDGTVWNPEIGSGSGDGHSILLFIKEHFTHSENSWGAFNSIGGCLEAPVWGLGAQQEEGAGSPVEADFDGDQYVTIFNGSLSTGSELLGNGDFPYLSYWTKYYVNQCDLVLKNPDYTETDIAELYNLTGQNVGIQLVFADDPNTEASGWSARIFDLAVTTVNIFDEESSLSICDSRIGTFNISESPDVVFFMPDTMVNDSFIKKTKIYMKSDDTDIWYLQFYLNHNEGEDGIFYSTVSGARALAVTNSTRIGQKEYRLNRNNVKDFNEVNSYESETFVSEKDAENISNLKCRYKTSVVANNRLYVGNIKQGGKIYADRMLKSVDTKYGVLPASNFIDVAINDGDEITALSFFKDKLLQFKRNKVFVINTSGDYEFLEDTFYNVGVLGQYSVIETQYGICWANANGFYLYDGEKLTNLIDNKIPTSLEEFGLANNRWCASSGPGNIPEGDCVVGYSSKRNIALINFTRSNKGLAATPTGAVYHFPTNSWTMLFMVWNNDSNSTSTGDMSNMITNVDGDILFYHHSAVVADVTDGVNTIRKWEHDALSTVHSTKLIYFTTKDITFGNISVRKKIYGVYITYRVGTDGTDSGVAVHASVNGESTFNIDFSTSSKFAFGASNDSGTACYTGEHLDETDGKWKTAELKFATPSQVNNIISLQLQFIGTTPYNFEINDISVSYRAKNIK